MIPKQLEERIVRLHFVEKWPVGTIARHVGVHHTTVKRVLHHQGVRVPSTPRPSMVEPYLPFIHETLAAYQHQLSAYYATSELWDDGMLDPVDTRNALGIAITSSLNAPLGPPGYGIFRF